jgi:hypothetical protein
MDSADLMYRSPMNGDAADIKIDVNAVRLQQAVLCADCEVISDSPYDTCAICGSRSLLPLSRVLGEIRPTSIPAVQEATVQEAAAQRPSVVPDAVFVLTSPVPHRPRQRRRASQG